jgi:hypothetical protein
VFAKPDSDKPLLFGAPAVPGPLPPEPFELPLDPQAASARAHATERAKVMLRAMFFKSTYLPVERKSGATPRCRSARAGREYASAALPPTDSSLTAAVNPLVCALGSHCR